MATDNPTTGKPYARTPQERIADADQRANAALSAANDAAANGQHAKAERLYARATRWLDESNRLRGNGEACAPRVRGGWGR